MSDNRPGFVTYRVVALYGDRIVAIAHGMAPDDTAEIRDGLASLRPASTPDAFAQSSSSVFAAPESSDFRKSLVASALLGIVRVQ
jgi:hypothetical protein